MLSVKCTFLHSLLIVNIQKNRTELVTRPGQKMSSLDKHFEQQLQQQQAALSMSPGPAVWVSAAAQANATQVRGHLLLSTALKQPPFKTEFYTTLSHADGICSKTDAHEIEWHSTWGKQFLRFVLTVNSTYIAHARAPQGS